MPESTSEQGVKTDGGLTREYVQQVVTHMPVRMSVFMCVDEVLEEEWERGVTVIYVITYQMKQEGCVNQRVNTQLDK